MLVPALVGATLGCAATAVVLPQIARLVIAQVAERFGEDAARRASARWGCPVCAHPVAAVRPAPDALREAVGA